MDIDTSDYFAYKKNKLNKAEGKRDKGSLSRFSFLFQLFIATFVIMFIVIVIGVMKYSSKMDIEYDKGDLTLNNPEPNKESISYSSAPEPEQRKIDKRLNLIQQEENAPYEAKILSKNKNEKEIIDPVHLENNKRLEKQEKIEKLKARNLEQEKIAKQNVKEEVKLQAKKNLEEMAYLEKNITIMSKVLVGRYPTFEEAQAAQDHIKANDPHLTPYVRKIGSVFAVQLGSHQDFSLAKAQAQTLKAKGYDVWIYQQ